MNILITGGAGYIGSHSIIEILENRDYNLFSLDNFSNSEKATFDRIKKITGKEITNFDCDLTDRQAVENVFHKLPQLDGVIHFAALKSVGESMNKPLLYYQNNLTGLVNLLEQVSKSKVPNFIFSSSCTVYGNIAELPATEETPLQVPESPYGYTKYAGEKILEDFIKSNRETKAISLRYFNPVGAHHTGLIGELPLGKPNNLVPIITQFVSGKLDTFQVFGDDYPTRDGTAIRDYIHVSDIARAHLLALEYLQDRKDHNHYETFNLGIGQGVTVLEVVKAFEKVSGIKVSFEMSKRRPGDVPAIYADITKSKKVLNWEPVRNIDDAMASAWKWQKNLNIRHDDKVLHG